MTLNWPLWYASTTSPSISIFSSLLAMSSPPLVFGGSVIVPAMSERERMIAGELYLATDDELMRGRSRARELTARYNGTGQDDQAERRALLDELLGAAGEHVWIEPPFFCDYGWNIELGDAVFLN